MIVSADLSKRPFVLTDSAGATIEAEAVVIASGATANYLGLPSEEKFMNYGVSACAVCDGALPRFRPSRSSSSAAATRPARRRTT